MTTQRGPQNTAHRGPGKCGSCRFHVVQGDPLSAEASIARCVRRVIGGVPQLVSLRADFQQTGFLTVIEADEKYDPNHPKGASFITYIKAKVCGALWSMRRREMKYVACDVSEEEEIDDGGYNPLVAALAAEACAAESLEDEVIRAMNLETFRGCLPVLLSRLTPNEQEVIRLKYEVDASGREIAEVLDISAPRVSQLLKSALHKLKRGYLAERKRR